MKLLVLLTAAFTAGAAESGNIEWIENRGGSVVRDAQSRVTGLRLDLAWVNDGDISFIASLPDLKTLDLSFTLITDIGLEQLSTLKGVEHLNLQSAELLTDTAIAHIRGWKQLRSLNLRGTDITDTSYTQVTNNGMEFLAPLNRIEQLSIGGNKISGPGLHILKSLPRLKRLNLSGAQKRNSGTWATTIKEGDMETIGALAKLESLNLAGLKVSNSGLSRLKGMTQLRELDLSKTQASGDGLAILQQMPQLTSLKLWKAGSIADSAAPQLAALKSLKLLDIAETSMTEAGVDTIRKSLPACRILWR
jgi:internalin A